MIQFNALLTAFLAFFVFRASFKVILALINFYHLRRYGDRVPRVFKGFIDREKLSTIAAYTADAARFGIVESLFDQALLVVILLSGFLPWLTSKIVSWNMGFIGGGLAFFALIALITTLFDIPFNLYSTFVIEERYGFNTRTKRLWLLDWIKGLVVSGILGGLIILFLLLLVSYAGDAWWFFAWIVLSAFEMMIMWLYPVLIAPLFNRFEPIANKELEHKITTLMEKTGLAVKGVFQMDAGKRSKHSNAYFMGIGRAKRIVLFDTLLASHPDQEILSVLAHEAGHYMKKHVAKQLILLEALSLVGLFILSELLEWRLMYHTFGFQEPLQYVGIFLVPAVLSPLAYFLRPLVSALSRKYEREADDIAISLMGTPDPMKDALIRLSADNLADLAPHPVYSWFHYSHPPPVERIERLEAMRGDVS